MEGTIKWFNESKGFGFLKADNGEELFFHISSIQKDGYKNVFEDQKVTFDIGENSKGECAVNIKVLDE